ncbi:hypothetical protein D3C79_794720 [compost metagenome]
MQALARREEVERAALATTQVDQRTGLQTKGEALRAVGAGTVEQHRISLLQALGRLAQGAGRQAAAIAQATRSVDQHQFQVTGQAVVLHAVVTQDQVQRLAGQQCLHGAGAVGVDHQRHTRALNDQQRFIAGLLGTLRGFDTPGQARRFCTVAAADHPHLQPLAPAMLDQPEDHRRLAGATNGDVAHHDDRYRGAVAGAFATEKPCALARHYPPVKRLERAQQGKGRVPGVPGG